MTPSLRSLLAIAASLNSPHESITFNGLPLYSRNSRGYFEPARSHGPKPGKASAKAARRAATKAAHKSRKAQRKAGAA